MTAAAASASLPGAVDEVQLTFDFPAPQPDVLRPSSLIVVAASLGYLNGVSGIDSTRGFFGKPAQRAASMKESDPASRLPRQDRDRRDEPQNPRSENPLSCRQRRERSSLILTYPHQNREQQK